MKLTRRQTVVFLLGAALLFGFTLFQASWLAPEAVGRPKLVAANSIDLVRDTNGCIAQANAGFGEVAAGPDVQALRAAAGIAKDAIRVPVEAIDGKLVVTRQFKSTCAADLAQPREGVMKLGYEIPAPDLFWQFDGDERLVEQLAQIPAPVIDRSAFIVNEKARRVMVKLEPSAWVFSIERARACASEYRLSGMWGGIPASCRNDTMLLTLDDLGYTLWGWPDRFLARMKDANVRLIIAGDVVDGRIQGLTDVNQYGDIAKSYNGYMWVDDIEALGPALTR